MRWRNIHVDGVLAFQEKIDGIGLVPRKGGLKLDTHMDPIFFFMILHRFSDAHVQRVCLRREPSTFVSQNGVSKF